MISYTAPSESTNLQAKALSHSQVRITWEPVSDDGGDEVDGYKLVVTGPGLSSPIVREFTPSDSNYTVDGLVNNTNYT